jgi:hypothetical protein
MSENLTCGFVDVVCTVAAVYFLAADRGMLLCIYLYIISLSPFLFFWLRKHTGFNKY